MQVSRIDHIVLTVRDIDATCDFYTSILGMQVVTFENNRKALQFANQKINIHQAGKELEPKALVPTPGSADICFITEIPLYQVIDSIKHFGVEVVDDPIQRTGAVGIIKSIYIRDPDGNLIEISNYLQG